jgi:hypothetical protein
MFLYTFEFLILMTPYLQTHHFEGNPSVDVAVKHRQLARQVGAFIEHPPENSMASFTNAMLDEGTTFIFGSWICVANLLGGFNSHLANSKEPEDSSSTTSSNLDDMLLPDLAQQTEKMSVFNAISTRDAPGLVGSDPNRFVKTTRSKSLSNLEKNWNYRSRSRTWAPPLAGRLPFLTSTRTLTKSTLRATLHLQVGSEKDSEMREPPLVTQPPP